MTTPIRVPKDIWLRCGQPVLSRPDRGCRCGGWTEARPRPWHVPAGLDTAAKIAWINEHTGNTKPFRPPREWRPIERKDD